MRTPQLVFLALGLVALLVSTVFIGSDTGDVLWRAGVSVLLVDVVIQMLWPSRSPSR